MLRSSFQCSFDAKGQQLSLRVRVRVTASHQHLEKFVKSMMVTVKGVFLLLISLGLAEVYLNVSSYHILLLSYCCPAEVWRLHNRHSLCLQPQCTASDKTNKNQLRIKANQDQSSDAAQLHTNKGYGLLIVLANLYLLWYTSLQTSAWYKKSKAPKTIKDKKQSVLYAKIYRLYTPALQQEECVCGREKEGKGGREK